MYIRSRTYQYTWIEALLPTSNLNHVPRLQRPGLLRELLLVRLQPVPPLLRRPARGLVRFVPEPQPEEVSAEYEIQVISSTRDLGAKPDEI